jgi:hypothetical protein
MRVAPFRGSSGVPMCDKCVEHDKKSNDTVGFRPLLMNQITIDGLKKLIADLEAQKAALHPEHEK